MIALDDLGLVGEHQAGSTTHGHNAQRLETRVQNEHVAHRVNPPDPSTHTALQTAHRLAPLEIVQHIVW